MSEYYQIGEVVLVRSGGPVCTVQQIDGDLLHLVYFNAVQGDFATIQVNKGVVRLATSKPESPPGVSNLRSTSVARSQ